MKRTLFTLFFALLVSAEGFSQTMNIQDKLKSSLEEGTHIGLHANLDNKLGNTNLLSLDTALYIIFNYNNHRLSLLADASYAYQDSFDIIVSRTFENLNYTYSFYDWVSIEAFTQYEYDKFRRLFARSLLGLGLRFTHVARDIMDMSLGTAYMFEYNKTIKDGEVDSGLETFLFRWSGYIHIGLFITERVSFYNTLYVQPNLEYFEDYLVSLDTHLAVQVNEYFSFDVVSRLDYDNKPIAGVKELDYSINIGIGLKYSFPASKPSPSPVSSTASPSSYTYLADDKLTF